MPGQILEINSNIFAFECKKMQFWCCGGKRQKVYSRTRSMTRLFYSWASIFSLFWLIHSVSFLTPLCSLLQLSKPFHFIIKINPFCSYPCGQSVPCSFVSKIWILDMSSSPTFISFCSALGFLTYRIKFKPFTTFF